MTDSTPSPLPPGLIVAITGASGAIYGITALRLLHEAGVETHLIISAAAETTIQAETTMSPAEVCRLANHCHANHDLTARLASGSFITRGMLIAPCSIKTLSAVANSYNDTLITRAADVCLKEGRPVVLAVRETPLHSGHLRLMQSAASSGAIIFPPVPSFYGHPTSIEQVITGSVARMLLRLGIDTGKYDQWGSEDQPVSL